MLNVYECIVIYIFCTIKESKIYAYDQFFYLGEEFLFMSVYRGVGWVIFHVSIVQVNFVFC